MLTIHDSYQLTYRVGGGDSAKILRLAEGDDFPDVLATSRMVALMELAAARLMRPLLSADTLSVGVAIEVTHSAPTLIGQEVTAKAIYLGQEGRLFLFQVELHDGGGQAGIGTHKRAIVQTERLLGGAEKRKAG
ncbi:thioesterase family protein [Candidatus Magnetaquicoccus inordinatus]|uniref:thioesterase family protein n=1 Tax=Candidatus Magnetaquicoccus inordinatus TaxID=2496818 RepID=UPI00102AA30D|nr:hotdog domain-containing protein [Candidatus Magnetaquicoccus inordinatus]